MAEMAVHQAMKDGNQAMVESRSRSRSDLGIPAAMIHSGIEAVNHAISERSGGHLTRYENRKGMR